VLGHGAGYEYPHNHDGAWVSQQYLPDPLIHRRWYEPSDRGFEQEIADRMHVTNGSTDEASEEDA
jgi:putative ATPase